MPKINQEEYEVLKELDDKWKWIARNYNGALITYTDKPTKNPNLYWDSFGERMDDRLFQFIQWEDEEPYEIAELIEEYESDEAYKIINRQFESLYGESEEKEVKDLEWVKAKLKKDHKDGEVAKSQIKDGEKIDGIDLNSYWRGRQTANYIARCYLEDLDEPETLSQEWIDENKEMYLINDTSENAVPDYKLQNLLVPRQEEVDPDEARFNRKVNKIIKAIENPKRLKLRDVVEKMESLSEVNQKQWLDRLNEKFGEIEQEPKYYVIDKEDNILLIRGYEGIEKADNLKITNSGGGALKLTEKEIKDYDERYWPFAVKVEELEE